MEDSTEPASKKAKHTHKEWKQNKSSKRSLDQGLKGFLCTSNFGDKYTVKEAYNLLNNYADKLYSDKSDNSEKTGDKVDDTEKDICDELAEEISNVKATETKQNPHRRFQAVDTGAKNCIFIQTTLDDPVHLASSIATDILNTGAQLTKHLLRMIPIEYVCKATVSSISENINPLLDKHFTNDPKTFGIVINRRYNNVVEKDKIITKVAAMVSEKNSQHKVKNPNITILLEIIKSWCLIGILPDYNKFKKYNLLELSLKSLKKDSEVKEEEKKSETDNGNNEAEEANETTKQ